jgi:hypothetical protein
MLLNDCSGPKNWTHFSSFSWRCRSFLLLSPPRLEFCTLRPRGYIENYLGLEFGLEDSMFWQEWLLVSGLYSVD